MDKARHASIYIRTDTGELLEWLSSRSGLSRSAFISQLIHAEARKVRAQEKLFDSISGTTRAVEIETPREAVVVDDDEW